MKYIQSFFEAGYVGYPSAIASGSAKTLKTREGNRPDDSKDGDNDDELDEGKPLKFVILNLFRDFLFIPTSTEDPEINSLGRLFSSE